MISCITPLKKFFDDNINTLQYGNKAIIIKNNPTINQDSKIA